MIKLLNNKSVMGIFTSLVLSGIVSCKPTAMDKNPKNGIEQKETPKGSGELTEKDMEWMIQNIDFFGNSVEKINSKSVYSIVDVDKFYDNQKDGDRHEKK